jgi:hypothetical protein
MRESFYRIHLSEQMNHTYKDSLIFTVWIASIPSTQTFLELFFFFLKKKR